MFSDRKPYPCLIAVHIYDFRPVVVKTFSELHIIKHDERVGKGQFAEISQPRQKIRLMYYSSHFGEA